MLEGLKAMNQRQFEHTGDPEIQTRIAQYEMAFACNEVFRNSLISKESPKPPTRSTGLMFTRHLCLQLSVGQTPDRA